MFMNQKRDGCIFLNMTMIMRVIGLLTEKAKKKSLKSQLLKNHI